MHTWYGKTRRPHPACLYTPVHIARCQTVHEWEREKWEKKGKDATPHVLVILHRTKYCIAEGTMRVCALVCVCVHMTKSTNYIEREKIWSSPSRKTFVWQKASHHINAHDQPLQQFQSNMAHRRSMHGWTAGHGWGVCHNIFACIPDKYKPSWHLAGMHARCHAPLHIGLESEYTCIFLPVV